MAGLLYLSNLEGSLMLTGINLLLLAMGLVVAFYGIKVLLNRS
jgi:hypothetical protein